MSSPSPARRAPWPDRLVACVGVVMAVGVLGLTAIADHRAGVYRSSLGPLAGLSTAGLLLVVPVWVVRRWRTPTSVAVAGGLAGLVSLACSAAMHAFAGQPTSTATRADAYTIFEMSVLALVLVLTVRYGETVPAAVTAGLISAAVVLRPLAVEATENSLLVALLTTFALAAVLVTAVAVRLLAADRRRHAERVRLEQRLDFARDLHDFVAHHVTGVVVQAQGAQAVAASRPELTVPALEQIERAGAEALGALRDMVTGLRAEATPGPAHDVEQLRRLVGSFRLPDGGPADLVEDGPVDRVPGPAMAVLHRVAMESLTNVRKHAAGSRDVTVRLRARPGVAELEISDDGTGARTRARTGYGLVGLEERVAAAGGTLRAGPGPHGGWTVLARVPARGARKVLR